MGKHQTLEGIRLEWVKMKIILRRGRKLTINIQFFQLNWKECFIYSSVDEHSGCFCILAIISNAAVNIGVHMSFQVGVFILFI